MPSFQRRLAHRYSDPLAVIWTACAEQVGFRVRRTSTVYASSDGRGTLLIGTDDTLDADDSLAQMILHELCHALVEGEDGEALEDWGLDNQSNRDRWREHACLRLQAYLAASVGLRGFLAPTTAFRMSFWDVLPADPFAAPDTAGGRREASCVAARRGAWRASQTRWAVPLKAALAATAAVAKALHDACSMQRVPARRVPEASVAQRSEAAELPLLWEATEPQPPLHPAGHAIVAAYYAGHGCHDCAWFFVLRGRWRCRHGAPAALPDDAPPCARWEAAEELECRSCGACCREAYHSVEVSAAEAVNRKHPELVLLRDTHRKLRRTGERCAALVGGETATDAFSCSIYPDRPRSCREFERGGAHCLDARRRVGLSL